MDRSPRIFGAVALLALAGIVAIVLLVTRGGGAHPRSTPDPVTRSLAATPPEKERPGHRLALFHKGHPMIAVKKGAQVALRASPGGKLIRNIGWRTEWGSPVVLSVFRTKGRWAGVPTPYTANDELAWVKLDDRSLRAEWTPYSIVINLSQHEGEMLRGTHVERSFLVTIGAPGSETPTGRFAITDTFIGGLDPAYGCCALATTATQHLLSGWLGGNRIAIHGTTGALGLALSHGCVRAANPDVRALVNHVPTGAPVVITQ